MLTQAVAADPEVAALLNERRIETEVVPAALGGQTHVIRAHFDSAGARPTTLSTIFDEIAHAGTQSSPGKSEGAAHEPSGKRVTRTTTNFSTFRT